jgi:hypothetical protein
MDFLAMQNEVLAHGFEQSVYRSRVKNWLNEAQGRIARILELPTLYTTTVISTVKDTDTYTLNNAIRINGITDPSSPSELTYVNDPADVNYYNYAGQSVGRPLYYTLSGQSSIRFSPVPDSAYSLTVDYYAAPTPLSADGDISALPSDYHDIMISYALSRAYRSEDDMQMSQFFYAEFMRDLTQMGADRQFVVRDGPRQVPGMWNL